MKSMAGTCQNWTNILPVERSSSQRLGLHQRSQHNHPHHLWLGLHSVQGISVAAPVTRNLLRVVMTLVCLSLDAGV